MRANYVQQTVWKLRYLAHISKISYELSDVVAFQQTHIDRLARIVSRFAERDLIDSKKTR